MRARMGLFAIAMIVGVAIQAHAEVSSNIHVNAEAHGLTIRIDNLQVAHNSLETRGDRIYIDVPAISTEQQIRLSDDRTVKMVQTVNGRHPRISVQLRHGRQKTKAIGMAATVENIDGGVVLHVPRWPIVDEAVVAKPIVAKPAVVAQDSEPAAMIATDTKAQGSAIPALVTAVQGAQSVPTVEDDESTIAGTRSESDGNSLGLVMGLLLIVGGAGFFYWRSKQSPQPAAELENFRVVATKHLGGKAKVVWLNVGERNMIVSVGESGTQLLSEWGAGQQPAARRAEAPYGQAPMVGELPWQPGTAPITPTLMDMPDAPVAPNRGREEVYDFRSTFRAARKAQEQEDVFGPPQNQQVGLNRQSPSVAGLVKLREQAPSVSTDVATQDADADAEWARELLKATRDTMFRRVD